MVLCAYGWTGVFSWSSISSLRECLIAGLILTLHLLCDHTRSDAKLTYLRSSGKYNILGWRLKLESVLLAVELNVIGIVIGSLHIFNMTFCGLCSASTFNAVSTFDGTFYLSFNSRHNFENIEYNCYCYFVCDDREKSLTYWGTNLINICMSISCV